MTHEEAGVTARCITIVEEVILEKIMAVVAVDSVSQMAVAVPMAIYMEIKVTSGTSRVVAEVTNSMPVVEADT